jgi:glycosyltransferase involved in cell wall biosynthesis
MKILFILPRYHTNYIEVFKSLSIKGYKIKLCVYNFGLIEDHKFIKPEYVQPSFLTKFINFFFRFKLNKYYLPKINDFNKILSQFSPDIVILRPYSKLFTFFILILRIFNKFELIFYHQTDDKNLKSFNFSFKFFKFFLISQILRIKSYSPLFKETKNLFFKKLYYLPFVSNIRLIRNKKLKQNKFLMIGKFLRKKNHEMFVRGIKFLNNNHDIKATIIGEVSSLEQKEEFFRIKKLIKKLKLENKITLIKNINYKRIKKFYYKNDFFVLPTDHDPAPYSILEAMSHGCMVLCSSSCGTKNYIKKNLNGFTFDNNNQLSLNKNMLKMINNKKKFLKNKKKNDLYLNKCLSKKNFDSFFEQLIKK